MKKIIRLITFTLLVLPLIQNLVSGDSLNMNGLEFSVNHIRIVTPDSGKPPFLGVDFNIYNATDTRKIDLTKDLKFSLADEFGNNYSRLKLPNDFMPESVPGQSVYPRQTHTTQLAFELPVARATSATLQFDGSSWGISDPIRIPLFLPKNDNIKSVRIVAPGNGATVERGVLVHLHVTVTGSRVPDGIIVDAFNYTYEDHSPSIDNVYDLNIPVDFALGPQSINTIAKWQKNTDGDSAIASDNIILNIRDSSPVSSFEATAM